MIRRSGGPVAEVLRSWGSILAVALLFVLMAATVDPVDREEDTLPPLPGQQPIAVTPTSVQPDGQVVAVDPNTGQTLPPGVTVPATVAGGPPPGQSAEATAAGARPCPDRALQVPGDPYSPPCVAFSGDNGGATHRGVTDDAIVVAVRQLEGPTAGELFAELSGQPVISSKEAVEDTILAMAEYFSSRFQMYGRHLEIVFYSGQGNGSQELLGSGQDRALADAVRVSEEIQAFADVSGITTPYADALSRQQVVNIGAPYPPLDWFLDRRPYAYSLFPDGTKVVDTLIAWLEARMVGSPTVQFAPQFNGQQRVFGVIGPENPEYQSSGDRFGQNLDGISVALGLQYRIDINSMPNQASNIIAQMKDAGVTTIVCACDPVMLALGLAPKANEQDYHPEWITGGLAFVEQDIVAQLIDPSQWDTAFGLAFNSESEPITNSFPRSAYRAMRPTTEPAFGVEELYYQMYLLAIGIQGAGPNLTPETFEQGMFAYPGAFGPRGSWSFSPTDYTSVDDFREIWWDPDSISAQNARQGAWIQINDGRRWTDVNRPTGPAPYFER